MEAPEPSGVGDEYEFGVEPDWRGERSDVTVREHSVGLNVMDLMAQTQIEITRVNLIVPFSHDPTKKYVAATLTKGDDRKWKVDGYGAKFGSSTEAAIWYLELLEAKRAQMLQDEFKESGI